MPIEMEEEDGGHLKSSSSWIYQIECRRLVWVFSSLYSCNAANKNNSENAWYMYYIYYFSKLYNSIISKKLVRGSVFLPPPNAQSFYLKWRDRPRKSLRFSWQVFYHFSKLKVYIHSGKIYPHEYIPGYIPGIYAPGFCSILKPIWLLSRLSGQQNSWIQTWLSCFCWIAD